MKYVTFNIILDDIVFPDGQTQMGVIGGGGPQTAFGMRLWCDSVGLVSGVGPDLPEEVQSWLDLSKIDQTGLSRSHLPTPRAWQVMEADGKRTQIWRVSHEVVAEQLGRSIERIPAIYQRAKAFHFGVHPLEIDFDFITELSKLEGIISVEPFRSPEHPLPEDQLHALMRLADIISPNIEEAAAMLGENDPQLIISRLFDAGARVVSLRMGPEGSLVAERSSREILHIPSVPVTKVDPVGAGNAYCGGFLVGWCETKNIINAGLYGAVSASFLVEQIGVPIITDEICMLAAHRLDELRSRIDITK